MLTYTDKNVFTNVTPHNPHPQAKPHLRDLKKGTFD
jgi:hypothetical protein